METAIALVLTAVGAALLVAGYRLWQRLTSRDWVKEPEERRPPSEPEGPVWADGIVCLFADRFVRPLSRPATGRDRAFAPLTDQELDPEDFALQLLYATMAELFSEGYLDFRIVPREPTYTPPFPQKAWELQLRQLRPLPSSPLVNAMSVALEMLTGRKKRRRDEEEGWVAIDDVIDRMLRAIRQELSFWERTTVYGDLRNYVMDALVAQGYLMAPERSTWLDRLRGKRPQVNRSVVEGLEEEARGLRERLVRFRRTYGSPAAQEDLPSDGPLPIQQVDPHLLDADRSLGDLPLDDCLRTSLYEVLTALRQLEPSGDAGV
ncbi:MAG: hypothetical protein H5T86_12410 [Armatimonadetes bacterium]|nr:hypothetical protein [Armatimonadota bacterium]